MSTLPLTLIDDRLEAIGAYLSLHGYASYDPYDGLESPLAQLLPGWFAWRLWQQAVRFAPINVRPLLGIRKMLHTKTLSDLASAHALLHQQGVAGPHAEQARVLLDMLSQASLPSAKGMGWGLRFRFATRFVRADRDAPNSYQTINAIHAYLDGCDALEDSLYLHLARLGIEFLEHGMGFREAGAGMYCIYWKGLETGVYNISGLMLGLAARMYACTGERVYRQWSTRLLQWLREGQNPDGSWYYSSDGRGRWIDGYHTGFVLEGLCRALRAGVLEVEEVLLRGARFYLDRMLMNDGIPIYYYPSRLYPIDVQNAAQAVQTLALLSEVGLCSPDRVWRTLQAVDLALWNKQGYYDYLKTPLVSYTTPMHRWGTGPMYLALAYARRCLGAAHGK